MMMESIKPVKNTAGLIKLTEETRPFFIERTGFKMPSRGDPQKSRMPEEINQHIYSAIKVYYRDYRKNLLQRIKEFDVDIL